MYDVAIIGAGVTGCAIARELSRYRLSTCVIEREEDVCCGTSKANSAIIHAGYDAHPGSLKAKLNVEGNRLMDDLSRDLDIPFRRNGSLVVLTQDNDPDILNRLYEQGQANGVPDLRILSQEETRQMEPHLADGVIRALYAPTGGIVCPFELTMGLAENASANGVDFFFNAPVTSVEKTSAGSLSQINPVCANAGNRADSAKKSTVSFFLIKGKSPDLRFESSGSQNYREPQTVCDPDFCRDADGSFSIRAKLLVNAAGLYADFINNQLSSRQLHITPRRGQYQLLDKSAGKHVDKTIFQAPSKMGKGVLVAPTVHGNLLVGPTAEDIGSKEGVNTTREGLAYLAATASKSVANLPFREVITSFAGLRAHEDSGDFVLGPCEDVPGLYNAAGIESPGLSSAPAIGRMIAGQIAETLSAEKKAGFHSIRRRVTDMNRIDLAGRNAKIQKNPAYGRIICRCESVSEGEILEAIHRPLGARSLDAVKRRTRAGMGRCQSGFCSPKVMEILEHELSLASTRMTKHGPGSEIVYGENKKI